MTRLVLLLALLISNDPVEISRINGLKRSAEAAYKSGDYTRAINAYRYLADSMKVNEQEVMLNLGHAYFQSQDTAQARTFYARAATGENQGQRGIAYQQLGVLARQGNQLQESLSYLKASIKADPTNHSARYDFEVVRKLLNQQQEQEQENQEDQDQEDKENEENENEENQDQENQDQENKDQEGQDQDQKDEQNKQDQSDEQKEGDQEEQQQEQQPEEGEEQDAKEQQEQSVKEKLEQMNIPEDKAMMILEAMKNAEIQYLQQQKRKATEKPKSNKPDW